MNQITKQILYLILLSIFIYYFAFYLPSKKDDNIIDVVNNTPEEELVENDYFERNLECLKLKDNLEEKIENRYIYGTHGSLEQIFYSPKVNSCVYIDYLDMGYMGDKRYYDFYQKRLFNVLDDGRSSHPLEGCSVIEVGENCDEFDSKVEEYKK